MRPPAGSIASSETASPTPAALAVHERAALGPGDAGTAHVWPLKKLSAMSKSAATLVEPHELQHVGSVVYFAPAESPFGTRFR